MQSSTSPTSTIIASKRCSRAREKTPYDINSSKTRQIPIGVEGQGRKTHNAIDCKDTTYTWQTTLYVSSCGTQTGLGKCGPFLMHPPSQEEADKNCPVGRRHDPSGLFQASLSTIWRHIQSCLSCLWYPCSQVTITEMSYDVQFLDSTKCYTVLLILANFNKSLQISANIYLCPARSTGRRRKLRPRWGERRWARTRTGGCCRTPGGRDSRCPQWTT